MPWGAVAGAAIGAISAYNQDGSGQQTSSTTDQNPWAPANPYLQQLLAQYSSYGSSPMPYGSPQDMVAGLTPQQQQAAGMVGQGAQGGMQLNQQAQAGIQPFLNGSMMDVNSNPYLKAATDAAIRPITQNYQENVLPGVRSQFSVGTDAYDQSREGIAQGIASRGYLDAVGNVSSQMANRGYETGMNATLQGMGQVPNLTTSASAPGQAQWNIGALLQAQNQNQINAPAQFDQMQQQRLQQQLQAYLGIGSIGRGGSGTTSTTGAQSNPYLSAVGGGILGNQVYNMWPKSQTGPSAGTGTGMGASGMGGVDPW